jgi:hypothetical protein
LNNITAAKVYPFSHVFILLHFYFLILPFSHVAIFSRCHFLTLPFSLVICFIIHPSSPPHLHSFFFEHS